MNPFYIYNKALNDEKNEKWEASYIKIDDMLIPRSISHHTSFSTGKDTLNSAVFSWNAWKLYKNNDNYYIPYHFHDSITSHEKNLVKYVMDMISNNTCVGFIERTDHKKYINVTSIKDGCFANVGILSNENILNLNRNGCFTVPTIAHELLHIIGLYHEHMRFDRNFYVYIHEENIMDDQKVNFQIQYAPFASAYRVPYDYTSIMHYPENAFSIDPHKITIQTLDPNYQKIIGHASYPSKLDYKKVCKIYQCRECSSSKLTIHLPLFFFIFLTYKIISSFLY
uniref:Metalloendopeptidase n=1 Tax=Parastrongyloides trichosuri TaxID=131310 RepID=A0A0N4ZP25_PARTI